LFSLQHAAREIAWKGIRSPGRGVVGAYLKLSVCCREDILMGLSVSDRAASPLRVFGAMLRSYRVKAGMSLEQLGARVYLSDDMVGKIENGQRVPTEQFAAACDAVSELHTGGALAELRELLKDYLKQRAYPGWFIRWPEKEAQATVLRSFELVLIPGLLQTPGYARALLDNRIGSGSDDAEEIVAARMERQAILDRANPPELWVAIEEATLRRPVGGPAVMHEQLNHLLRAAQRPNVVLQVIPVSIAVHVALAGAGFVVADFADAPHVAYQETQVGGQVIEDHDDIALLLATWDRLRAEALPRSASLDLVEEVAKIWT
jgi:transcriptional regulator with XRE-family HTH domain